MSELPPLPAIPPHLRAMTPDMVEGYWAFVFQRNPKLAAKNAIRIRRVTSWKGLVASVTNQEQMTACLNETFNPPRDVLQGYLPEGWGFPKGREFQYDPQKNDIAKSVEMWAKRVKREVTQEKNERKQARKVERNAKQFEQEAIEQEEML